MRHDKATMNEQRRNLAIVGFLLPVLSILFGLPFLETNGPTFWYSISAMYYSTSGDLMRGALAVFGGYLLCYRGHDIGDSLTCKLSGVFAWGIVVFPCKCDAAGLKTGILQLPTPLSHVIHCIFAALLFGSFAYMIGCRFTKGNKLITEEKALRNTIYKVCATIILVVMALQVITSIFGWGWFTIINETIMLWAFSFAWAVKADMFKKFRDKD